MKSLLITLSLLLAVNSFSQLEEGSIKYDIEMSSDDPNMSMAINMMKGSTMEMFFTPNFSRVDVNMGMMMNMSTISDLEKNEHLMLMSGMMGKKAIPMTEEDLEKNKQDKPNFTVVLTEETKEILGYNCVKYILTTEEGQDITYWATEEIVASTKGNQYMDTSIKGFPLAFETLNQGMKMSFEAVDLKESLKDKESLFDLSIPKGYDAMTMDELKSLGK